MPSPGEPPGRPCHGPPVHFHGIVLGPSGFAAQGREWLRLCEEHGLCPSLCGARLGDCDGGESAADRDLIARCAARPRQPGALTLHHVLPPHFAPDPRAAANVLVTVFETDSLPPGWAARLNAADAVIVPTWFNVRSFARGGVAPDRLHALPVPADLRPFAPGAPPWPGLPPRRPRVFRFLSVSDWSLRKGQDVLLPAFGRTFAAHEAELVLKVMPRPGLDLAQLARDCRRAVAAAARRAPPAVHVLAPVLAADELPGLYAGCDAFALCSRGEGWGRPVHEAMAMALPVVASAGHALATLLPDPRLGFPVRGRSAPVSAAAAAATPAFAGQTWFEPDPVHLGEQLRAAFELRDPALGRAARAHVLSLCAQAPIAARLRALLAGLPAAATAAAAAAAARA